MKRTDTETNITWIIDRLKQLTIEEWNRERFSCKEWKRRDYRTWDRRELLDKRHWNRPCWNTCRPRRGAWRSRWWPCSSGRWVRCGRRWRKRRRCGCRRRSRFWPSSSRAARPRPSPWPSVPGEAETSGNSRLEFSSVILTPSYSIPVSLRNGSVRANL